MAATNIASRRVVIHSPELMNVCHFIARKPQALRIYHIKSWKVRFGSKTDLSQRPLSANCGHAPQK
jgi:hypothetical protein